ncbi:citrate (Si)-synthase [Anaplasmataceae bacterium AB001_6]|nr:citrate (Si)-synthase [Anaplasmataceae bacterium AB001_6]
MRKKGITFILENGEELSLSKLDATFGPSAIDVRELYKRTGLFTYDPGFFSTASCRSSVAFIDGDEGILRYRGLDISNIAESKSFLEVAYLLFYGVEPSSVQFDGFLNKVKKHSYLDKEVVDMIFNLPPASHPMSIMMSAFSVLSCLYKDLSIENAYAMALAKAPYVVAAIYHFLNGEEFNSNEYKYSDYCKNLLYLLFPSSDIPDVFVDAINKFCVLHADHEQNASTSTARMVASTQVPPLAAVTAAIGALWGKAHGGANESLLLMLKEINSVDDVPGLIARAKDPNDDFRIMGFGHRVYKNYDPRAKILKDVCQDVLHAAEVHSGDEAELFKIANKLESIALEDEYFISRKLYPNVDFYSGIVMRAIGFPVNMFTTMFATARIAGWMSQVNEMLLDDEQKLYRPRQLYIGK